jgi:DNA adenine methylase
MERSPMSAAQPIIPWIGGKRRLAEQIIPLFPEHVCYVEPFCGAAAVFFHKQPSKAEVLNDVNGELINLYRVVKHHLEEFIRQFKWAFTSRQIYKWHQLTVPETLTDIQRAARFFYLQKLSFGGKVEGQTFGTSTTSPPRLNLLRLEEDLSEAYLRLSEATIEHLPWSKCVDRYDRPHTLFFCDPPYWQTEGYGVDFPLAEYELMASLARSMAGTIIITVNDHPEMRRIFDGLAMQSVGITYTVGGADRAHEARELIIGNWRNGWPAPRPLSQQLGIELTAQ